MHILCGHNLSVTK